MEKSYYKNLLTSKNNAVMMQIQSKGLLKRCSVSYHVEPITDSTEPITDSASVETVKEYRTLNRKAKKQLKSILRYRKAEYKKAVYANVALVDVFEQLKKASKKKDDNKKAESVNTIADIAIFQFLKYQQADGEQVTESGTAYHYFNGRRVMAISPITIAKIRADFAIMRTIDSKIKAICDIKPSSVEVDRMHNSIEYHYTKEDAQKLADAIEAYADCTTSIKYGDDLKSVVVLAVLEYTAKTAIKDMDLSEIMKEAKKACYAYFKAVKRVNKLNSVSYCECFKEDADGNATNELKRGMWLVGIERNASADYYMDGLSRILDYESNSDYVKRLRGIKCAVIRHMKKEGASELQIACFKAIYCEQPVEQLAEQYNVTRQAVYKAVRKMKRIVITTPCIMNYLTDAKSRIAENRYSKSSLLSEKTVNELIAMLEQSNGNKEKSIPVVVMKDGKQIAICDSLNKAEKLTSCSRKCIKDRLDANSLEPMKGYTFMRKAE